MRKIGIGAFLGNAIVYIALVTFMAVVLYRDLEPNATMEFDVFGLAVRSEVLLVALFFVDLLVQRKLSAARGTGRFVDWLISMMMLVVIGPAIAQWWSVPYVDPGIDWLSALLGVSLDSAPSGFKWAAVLIFGIPAVLDVLGRDILGIGRGSRVVSIGADSTFEVSARPRVKLDSPWELELPNGRVMPFVPNEQMLERFEREVARRLPAPGAGTPPASSAAT